MKHNFFILTGGPGSGKTTLIQALSAHGYKYVEEVGRNIIKEEIAYQGDALPWGDKAKYADRMLSQSTDDYMKLLDEEDIYFFDRGIPDTLGYMYLEQIIPGGKVIRATKEYRYNPIVFILPPWKEIYETDQERKQDYAEAVATYQKMRQTYTEAGYSLIEVPCTSIEKRAEFIINEIKNNMTGVK